MLGTYYGEAFTKRGLAVVAPDGPDLDYVHDKYVGELVEGTFLDATRGGLVAVIERLRKNAGVDGIILGGTELPLILRDVPFDLPLLDTTRIHVDATLKAAL
jgi:aspartate racemase